MTDSQNGLKVFQILAGPGAGWGGGVVVVEAITRGLVEQGHSVCALCLSDIAGDHLRKAGAQIVTSSLWRRTINPFLDLAALWEIYQMCRREKYDIVNTHTSKGGFIGRIGARLAGVPLVVHTVHGYAFSTNHLPRWLAFIYTLLEKFATLFCDLIISVNAEDREAAIEKKVVPPGKIVTVLNGIDTARFENACAPAALRDELDPTGEAILIGSTGRLSTQKGFSYLISAMPLVLETYPNARLVIAGKGPLDEELDALIEELALSEQCRMLGFRDDVPELLSCLDIFVLPSLWEGLSISLLEAMAAGKPIVATDIRGTREVLEDGVDGLVVPSGDPAALAVGMISLIRDRERALVLGECARHKVKTAFSEEAMVRHTLDLYRSYYRRNI
jgi:glycosyltransferase involved in cell wall biosynthesis